MSKYVFMKFIGLLSTSKLVFSISAAEVTLSSLTLASRTATTLTVTWPAGYPKCYSFTVSHSTQDGSITVTQPADSDTSHTLTSLQPSTTYRIEVEAVRKQERADGQRAKVMGNFTTEGGGEERMLQTLTQSCYNEDMYMGVRKAIAKFVSVSYTYLHCAYFPIFSYLCAFCALVHIPVVPSTPVSSETIVPAATSTSLTPLRPSASAETAAGQRLSWCTVPKTWWALYLANTPILASGEFYVLANCLLIDLSEQGSIDNGIRGCHAYRAFRMPTGVEHIICEQYRLPINTEDPYATVADSSSIYTPRAHPCLPY